MHTDLCNQLQRTPQTSKPRFFQVFIEFRTYSLITEKFLCACQTYGYSHQTLSSFSSWFYLLCFINAEAVWAETERGILQRSALDKLVLFYWPRWHVKYECIHTNIHLYVRPHIPPWQQSTLGGVLLLLLSCCLLILGMPASLRTL